MKTVDVPSNVRERMRQVFNECYKAVQVCEDPDTGRRRWELFKELPDRRVSTSFVDSPLGSSSHILL